MEIIIFISIYIVKPTLHATMFFSVLIASFILFQSLKTTTTKGE